MFSAYTCEYLHKHSEHTLDLCVRVVTTIHLYFRHRKHTDAGIQHTKNDEERKRAENREAKEIEGESEKVKESPKERTETTTMATRNNT